MTRLICTLKPQAARAIAARKKESAEKVTNDQMEEADLDDEEVDEPPSDSQPKRLDDSLTAMDLSLIGIDQAILQSIDRCDNDEMKRRMSSCVMVIGGGLMFPGLNGWIEHLLCSQMPPNMQSENMEIITKTKVFN